LPEDQALLWALLHVSLWDPPPAPLRPRSVLDEPRVRIYAEAWGREGDVGVVGEQAADDVVVGACWMRLLQREGMAFVDDKTPQLGIAVFPPFQRQGSGGVLMRAALAAARDAGYHQVSLTVHPRNPAVTLYERCGFEKIGTRNTYHLMIASLRTGDRR
jgi:ribosomal protein S18 acetylase RimI-like enzyme